MKERPVEKQSSRQVGDQDDEEDEQDENDEHDEEDEKMKMIEMINLIVRNMGGKDSATSL